MMGVVVDYAHHPAELVEALATARRTGRRVVAVFQPHLYSRTRALCDDFARALTQADQVILTEVYGSRESALPGVDGSMIERAMRAREYERVEFVPEGERIVARLLEVCRPGDLVLTLGAGDIDQVSRDLVERLESREEEAESGR